jgi:hypothetical protein
MVNLQPVGAAADHAGLVALVDEGSEPAPVPTAPDPSSLFPGTLPVPFPFAFGASAGRVEDVVAAGAEIAEGAQGVLQGVILALTGANVARIEPLLRARRGRTRIGARGPVLILMAGSCPEAILSRSVRSDCCR